MTDDSTCISKPLSGSAYLGTPQILVGAAGGLVSLDLIGERYRCLHKPGIRGHNTDCLAVNTYTKNIGRIGRIAVTVAKNLMNDSFILLCWSYIVIT